MSDCNPVKEEVEKFNKKGLKKTTTTEKNIIPSKEDIDEEKASMQQGK